MSNAPPPPPSPASRFVGWSAMLLSGHIVAVGGWWLTTQPGSPFVADPVMDIRLLDVPPSIVYPRPDLTSPLGWPTVTFDVTVPNQGSLAGEQCVIEWRDATTDQLDLFADWRAASSVFGLVQGER